MLYISYFFVITGVINKNKNTKIVNIIYFLLNLFGKIFIFNFFFVNTINIILVIKVAYIIFTITSDNKVLSIKLNIRILKAIRDNCSKTKDTIIRVCRVLNIFDFSIPDYFLIYF